MNTKKRAQTFVRYVGLELKGAITARGFNANQVANTIERSEAAFNRWLNGKVDIPMSVLCEAAEVIDVDPQFIVDAAYNRMVGLLGERWDGKVDAEMAEYAASEQPGIVAKGLPPFREPKALSQEGYTLAASDRDYDAEIEAMQEEP